MASVRTMAVLMGCGIVGMSTDVLFVNVCTRNDLVRLAVIMSNGLLVNVLTDCAAAAFILLTGACHGALDGCGSFDASLCNSLSVKFAPDLRGLYHRIVRRRCTCLQCLRQIRHLRLSSWMDCKKHHHESVWAVWPPAPRSNWRCRRSFLSNNKEPWQLNQEGFLSSIGVCTEHQLEMKTDEIDGRARACHPVSDVADQHVTTL
jgi:hypothetical protein